jgi:hypothetical protein
MGVQGRVVSPSSLFPIGKSSYEPGVERWETRGGKQIIR